MTDPNLLDRYERRAEVIKAMAHPTRLCLVHELAERERCVCELTDIIGDDISTVSRHLTLLRNAGIVGRRKNGTQVFYSLRCRCVLDFLDCVEAMIAENAGGPTQTPRSKTAGAGSACRGA